MSMGGSSEETAPGPQPSPLKIAVLASGRGSNLQALIDAQLRGALPITIVLVASDKGEATALRRAERAGIATLALDPAGYFDRAAFDADLFTRIGEHAPALIVLAGFMRILDPGVLAPWSGRIINIHPSLLPKYRGLRTHQRVLDAGDTEHGASVHFVGAELDGGPTIAQAHIPVCSGDTSATLAQRLLEHEHRLLLACVALVAAGRVALAGSSVAHDGVRLESPLRLGHDGTLVVASA